MTIENDKIAIVLLGEADSGKTTTLKKFVNFQRERFRSRFRKVGIETGIFEDVYVINSTPTEREIRLDNKFQRVGKNEHIY